MKMNNKHDLPDIILYIVDYVKDQYSKGDSQYTPSSLNTPPQMFQLMQKHHAELEADYSEQLASLLGTSFHATAELALRQHPERYIVEERYFMDFEMPDGTTRRISGQIDAFDKLEGILQDFKVTSIFKAKKPEADDDWNQQGSVNKYIMHHNGIKVKSAQNIVYSKDWRRGESAQHPSYPNTPVVVVPLKLMNKQETEEFIRTRILEHEAPTPRECTPEERWADAPKFAVMKNKNKRAVSGGLHDTKDEAQAHADELAAASPKDTFFIEKREGDAYRRCKDYCPVSEWCQQFQSSGAAKIEPKQYKVDIEKELAEFDDI